MQCKDIDQLVIMLERYAADNILRRGKRFVSPTGEKLESLKGQLSEILAEGDYDYFATTKTDTIKLLEFMVNRKLRRGKVDKKITINASIFEEE